MGDLAQKCRDLAQKRCETALSFAVWRKVAMVFGGKGFNLRSQVKVTGKNGGININLRHLVEGCAETTREVRAKEGGENNYPSPDG